uniref:Uncharacterized protein n=1 Tax=Palpitomonas bilix TaxID=652834 RepID=A0A7S3GJ93_9EUKA
MMTELVTWINTLSPLVYPPKDMTYAGVPPHSSRLSKGGQNSVSSQIEPAAAEGKEKLNSIKKKIGGGAPPPMQQTIRRHRAETIATRIHHSDAQQGKAEVDGKEGREKGEDVASESTGGGGGGSDANEKGVDKDGYSFQPSMGKNFKKAKESDSESSDDEDETPKFSMKVEIKKADQAIKTDMKTLRRASVALASLGTLQSVNTRRRGVTNARPNTGHSEAMRQAVMDVKKEKEEREKREAAAAPAASAAGEGAGRSGPPKAALPSPPARPRRLSVGAAAIAEEKVEE